MRLQYPKKLFDTERIPTGGRVDDYWMSTMLRQVFKESRKGPALPSALKWWDPESVLKFFNLKAVEFGNWLNQPDRYEYLVGCSVSMYDLAKIIGFDNSQIGLQDNLSVAFGARGQSRALAHFEMHDFVINLTRYKREDAWQNDAKYLASGGVGSFGHEWAHAFDYFISNTYDNEFKNRFMLSDILQDCMKETEVGVFKRVKTPLGKAAKLMLELMTKICYVREGNSQKYDFSSYYRNLLRLVADPNKNYGKYWIRGHEIFARAFEVFLFYEGQRKGVSNPYLKKQKYTSVVYCNQEDYKSWRKEMVALLDYAASRI